MPGLHAVDPHCSASRRQRRGSREGWLFRLLRWTCCVRATTVFVAQARRTERRRIVKAYPLFLGRHDVSYSDLVSLDAGFDDRVGGFSRAQWIGASMRAWGVAGGKSQKRPTEGGRAREKTSRLGGGGFFLAVWAAVSRGKEGRGGEGGARQAASELLAGGLVLRGGERRGGLGGTHYNK